MTAATDEGDEAARPPTRRVLAAEWRRLHEPPAVLAVVTDALRGRPVARGVLVALVVVGAVVAWLTTDRWVASAVTAAGLSLVGTVTGWTMRPRTREEFEAQQRERVRRIRGRDADSGTDGRPAG